MQTLQKEKILIGIPYHEEKRYCLDVLFNTVSSLNSKYDYDVVLRWDLHPYGQKDNVKNQREFFRKLIINGQYSHLFFMGADTIPPDYILDLLLEADKDIIGGVYHNRLQPEKIIAWRNNGNLPKHRNIVEVDGMGMDCVLIKREVLEKISFKDWKVNDDDYPFYERAKKLGYKIYLHTGAVCRHYISSTEYV